MKLNKKQDWGWDSGLLRNRILKSLGIPETTYTKKQSLISVLAEADDTLDHLPFRISDAVLNTEKFSVMAELLGHPKNSTFWNTISQSDNIFMFCDPHRSVDNSVILASKQCWWNNQPAFNEERKTLTTQIITHNRQLNLSAYVWVF